MLNHNAYKSFESLFATPFLILNSPFVAYFFEFCAMELLSGISSWFYASALLLLSDLLSLPW